MPIMTERIQRQFCIVSTSDPLRLDQTLTQVLADYSRGQVQRWIRNGAVSVNQQPCTSLSSKLKYQDVIAIEAELEIQSQSKPQAIELDIVYEDDELLVINKPAGLVVHPGAGNPSSTLENALLFHHPSANTLPRAGLIHRLDKDTTGLLVVAKTLSCHQYLVDQLQQRLIKREYLALVHGSFIAGGSINEPIGRHPKARTKMAVVRSGKPAVTHFRILTSFPTYTLLKVMLETGRTHQIRVHLQHIKHPIVGDPIYHSRKNTWLDKAISRQALHARKLGLHHPNTGDWLEWESPIPDDFQHLLKQLEQQQDD